MDKKRKILSIGAHPDDADTSAAGLLLKLSEAGWEVRLLSLTDGGAGARDTGLSREELVFTRRKEAADSARILGGRYDVLSNPDGQLTPTLENREQLIRYIRRFAPDAIVTNRPNDYHADHRNASLLVQDAAYLLTVPRICPDTPCLSDTPPILFWGDDFMRPYPHSADIICPMSEERVAMLTAIASCHVCQYFDWMYWPNRMEKLQWTREEQIADLNARFLRNTAALRNAHETRLTELYGSDTAAAIKHIECYEISEYGGEPTEELLNIARRAE